MRGSCYDGCIHYGTQFERREEREERREEFRYSPLYMRMRRHSMIHRGHFW